MKIVRHSESRKTRFIRHSERSEESRGYGWLLAGALSLLSTPALATGGVECLGKTREGAAVRLQWGTSRGMGSGRISPYTLTIGEQKPDLSKVDEVGYWVGEGNILVRLVDPAIPEPQLLLLTELWKDGSHGGVLTVGKPLVSLPVKAVVRCEVE